MPFKTLDEVIKANSVMGDGIEYFKKEPFQFLELIKKNYDLATKYAQEETFSSDVIETMLKVGYASNRKFFSEFAVIIKNYRTHPTWTFPTTLHMVDTLLQSGKLVCHDTKNHPSWLYIDEQSRYLYIIEEKNSINNRFFYADRPNLTAGESSKAAAFNQGKHAPNQQTGLKYAYLKQTDYNDILTALSTIASILAAKLKTPGILKDEFSNGIDSLFPWLLNCAGAPVYLFLQKCIEFTPTPLALNLLHGKSEGLTDDYLKFLISKYPANKIVVDEVLNKMRDFAQKNRAGFRAVVLDKFAYNILDEMQQKNAALAHSFYDIAPEHMCAKYPAHVKNYPQPVAPTPVVIENTSDNPLPVLTVANFVREVRIAHISELNKLLAKYPGNITQQNVAADILNQARGLTNSPQNAAKIQLDINLLSNPNSALHYYLRGYVLSRLRTQLLVDLANELVRMTLSTTLDLNPNVGSSSSHLQIVPRVMNDEREEVKKELQKNTMEML